MNFGVLTFGPLMVVQPSYDFQSVPLDDYVETVNLMAFQIVDHRNAAFQMTDQNYWVDQKVAHLHLTVNQMGRLHSGHLGVQESHLVVELVLVLTIRKAPVMLLCF